MPSAGIFGSARVAAGGGGSISSTFQQATADTTDAASYSFASQAIGAASASRRVVVAVGWASAAAVSLSSATIGGVSATVDADSGNSGSNRRMYFISANVPTGTTATVALTLSGTAARVGIGLWTLTGGAATGQVATDVTTSTTGTLTVTTAVNDVVLAAAFFSGTSGTATAAWSSATERYDAQIENTFNSHTGADTVATTTSTGIGYTSSGITAPHNAPKVAVAYA